MLRFLNLQDATTVRHVLDASHRLLADPAHHDVVGFTVAYKDVEGRKTRQAALVVLVDRKPGRTDEPPAVALVPDSGVADAAEFLRDASFAGYVLLLDVQAVGALMPQPAVATAAPPASPPSYDALRIRQRPAFPGVSLGHIGLPGSGTLGAVLADAAGATFLLSNNHVLALAAGFIDGQPITASTVRVGDPITQPGVEPMRVRQPADLIAALEAYVPLHYVGRTVPSERVYADAAVARLTDPASAVALVPYLQRGGAGARVTKAATHVSVGDAVYKVGRSTGATGGRVTHVDVTVRLDYDAGSVIFDRQCLSTCMSAAGDSGSLVIGDNGGGVGLLVGGSGVATIFTPLLTILQLFTMRLS